MCFAQFVFYVLIGQHDLPLKFFFREQCKKGKTADRTP